jgi:hypothetical protein
MMAQVLDPVWIPLPDGARLAARVWLPEGALDSAPPCPTILEAIPYRRREGTLTVDHPRYDYWARQGFAGVRVDLRGSGDSDGVLTDEYLRQEQDDDLTVIEWIAGQPWSNGRVGMIGYSWGGFAGLQVAARRPPALGAVVTVNSTVRRYTDDCHYVGGAVNAHDMLSWATTMLVFDARPPDPEIVGERWRQMWDQRLDVTPPMIEPWLGHQLEDDYWRHGSVAFDYEAVACPVLAVGGWSDPYRNAVLDLLEHLNGPAFGLIGPWAHGYPHITKPGPQVGFLSECARFFGRYLRDDANGYDGEPALRAYVQDYDEPAAYQPRRSGRWVSLAAWPSAERLADHHRLRPGTLAPTAPDPAGQQHVCSPQDTGLTAGSWCPYGGPSQPLEQTPDDKRSLCFDTAPLQDPVDMLGFPRLRLQIAADRPQAVLVARLCDIAPTGASLLVTRGVLSLTHRCRHDALTPLQPGTRVDVELRLDCAGHRFAPGHRIRLAVSSTYWPWVWPTPEAATLTLSLDTAELELPLLGAHGSADLGRLEQIGEIATQPLAPSAQTQTQTQAQTVHRAAEEATAALISQPDFLAGRIRITELGLEVEDWGENTYRIRSDDPLSAEVRCRRRAVLARPGWETQVEAEATMTGTASEFVVQTELRARHNGETVATRHFTTRVPRFG